MLTSDFIQTVAEGNFRISEQLALEHIDMDPAPTGRPVPLLYRKPLERNSEHTRQVLSTAAGNPYRYEKAESGRAFCRPLVLKRSITVGTAMLNMRDRLTHLTALLQELNIPFTDLRGQTGALRDTTVDLIHEVTSFLAVIEIAAVEEHNRQLFGPFEAD